MDAIPASPRGARVVYVLRSLRPPAPAGRGWRPRRFYVGYTVDLARRLRQHNGLIKGGARRTARGGPWALLGYVRGFETQTEALSFEWALQRRRRSLRMRRAGAHGTRDLLAAARLAVASGEFGDGLEVVGG